MKLLYIHLVILSFTLTLAAPASSDDTIDLEEEIDKLCHQLGTRNRHVSMFGTIVSSITSFFPKTEPEPFHLTKEGIDDALHILDNTLKKAGVAKYLKKGEHIDLIPYGDFWAVHEFKTRPHAESIDTYWELYHEEGITLIDSTTYPSILIRIIQEHKVSLRSFSEMLSSTALWPTRSSSSSWTM